MKYTVLFLNITSHIVINKSIDRPKELWKDQSPKTRTVFNKDS